MSPRVSPPELGGQYPSVPVLRESRYSQSLERGLAILEVFTPSRPVLGIAEIADELGMSRSTTHRYVITLVALGFMEQEKTNLKYRLRLSVTNLGMSALSSTRLSDHADLYLQELCHRTSFTTSLAVLDGTEILYVDRVCSLRRAQSEVDLNLRAGSRLPAYCTAMGKVLLAGLPEPEQRKIIATIKLQKRGPHTITTMKALLTALDHIHEEGVAVDDEEFAEGLVAIAAPIRNENREIVAAINLAAHTHTIALADLVDQLQPHLLATADQLSARLGYRRDDEENRR